MKVAGRRSAARFLPGGIRARLFLLIALVLLPLLLLLAWVYWERYEALRSQALQTELEVAQALAATFAAHLEDVRRASYAVGAAITTFDPYTDAKAARVLQVVAGQYRTIRNLNWVAPEGVVIASSQPEFVGSTLAERVYFREVVAGRPFVVGDLTRRGILASEPTFAIATAVNSEEGNLRGLVVAGIEPSRLGELTATVQRSGSSAFAIFDRQGKPVYHSRGPLAWEDRERWRQTDPLLDQALKTGTAQIGRVHLAVPGGEWLSARVPLPETGWVVGTGRPYEVALAPVRERLLYDATVAAVIVLSAFFLAWLLARNIARPLLFLAEDARSMGEGRRIDRVIPEAPAEVLQLRGSVVSMAENLQHRAEALRRSEERYQLVNLATNDVIWDWDLASNKLTWSQALEKTFGYRLPNASSSISWRHAHLHPDDRERVVNSLQGAIDGGSSTWTEEYRFRRLDGSFATVLDRGTIQREADGKPIRMVGSIIDLTESRQAEEEIRRSRAQLAAVLEAVADGIAVFDMAGNLLLVNEAEVRIHEYAKNTWMGKNLADFSTFFELRLPDRQTVPLEQWPVSRVLRGETVANLELLANRTDTGQERFFSFNGSPVRDAHGEQILAVITTRDITQQKRDQEILRLNEAKFRAVFEQAAVGMGLVDFIDARWIDVNEAFCHMLGYSAEEMRATTWPQITYPEEVDLDLIFFRRMAAGDLDSYSVEKRFIRKDGNHLWARLTLSVVRDKEGRPDYEIAIVEDITERKHAEEELHTLKDELELRVQERTAELTALNQEMETFSYMVSHDLRAPLRHISSFSGLLEENASTRLDEEGRKYVRIIGDASRRMAALIDDLLNFSRLGRATVTKVRVDFAALVEEVRNELAPEAAGRSIDWCIEPLPSAEGDVALLRTVLVNLLGNALKYTRQRDPAIIEIGSRREGNEILFFVRDNGAGFDMRYAGKLFGVFQRLHPAEQFEGTGIGLASVRRIVERHGGRIWAEGEVDKGASFFFSLPAREL